MQTEDKNILFLCPFKAEAKLLSGIFPNCRSIKSNKFAGYWQFDGGQIITWNNVGKISLLEVFFKIGNLSIFSKVVLFGSAGALNPSLKVGDFFLCTSFRTDEENSKKLLLPARQGFKQTQILTVGKPVTEREKRITLYKSTNAFIVDMESYFFLEYLNNLPDFDLQTKATVIRFVSDTNDTPFHFRFPDIVRLTVSESRKQLLNL